MRPEAVYVGGGELPWIQFDLLNLNLPLVR